MHVVKRLRLPLVVFKYLGVLFGSDGRMKLEMEPCLLILSIQEVASVCRGEERSALKGRALDPSRSRSGDEH